MPTVMESRDAEIIRWVARREIVTINQFMRINSVTHEAARMRLHRLVDKEYLGRVKFSGVMSHPYTYFATNKGVDLVYKVHGDDGTRLTSRKPKQIRPGQIDHKLGINEFFTLIQAQTKESKYVGLHTWLNSKESKQTIPCEDKKLCPDSFGIFDRGDAEVCFFFEYDRGQMSQKIVVEKMKNYMRLIERGGHIELCKSMPVNVLLLTCYEEWAASIRKQIENMAKVEFQDAFKRANYMVSWESEANSNDMLGPSWMLCGGNGERVSFFS